MFLSKNGLLNWYYSMKKKSKNSADFWHQKLTLKVQFGTFWRTVIHDEFNGFKFFFKTFLKHFFKKKL
jgi:hypothetical protein